jgi:hypothetical protein
MHRAPRYKIVANLFSVDDNNNVGGTRMLEKYKWSDGVLSDRVQTKFISP